MSLTYVGSICSKLETWKTINELLNKRPKSSNIDCIKDSGNAIINRKEISNTINHFFCTIADNLASKIKRLQKLQNRAARIVSGSSFDAPSQPLIKELGWRTIDELITSESNTMVFKSIHRLAPQYMCDISQKNPS